MGILQVYSQGLTQHIVKNMAQCLKLMEKGWMSRSTGATLMNAESSRYIKHRILCALFATKMILVSRYLTPRNVLDKLTF